MTSTPFNVGLRDDTRVSSRVLRPPGGGHTDIFGGDPEPPRGRRAAPAGVATSAASMGSQGVGEALEPKPASASQPGPEPAANFGNGDVSQPAEPEPRQQTTKPQPKPEAPQPVDNRRGRVPPGGFSSGLW